MMWEDLTSKTRQESGNWTEARESIEFEGGGGGGGLWGKSKKVVWGNKKQGLTKLKVGRYLAVVYLWPYSINPGDGEGQYHLLYYTVCTRQFYNTL